MFVGVRSRRMQFACCKHLNVCVCVRAGKDMLICPCYVGSSGRKSMNERGGLEVLHLGWQFG